MSERSPVTDLAIIVGLLLAILAMALLIADDVGAGIDTNVTAECVIGGDATST